MREGRVKERVRGNREIWEGGKKNRGKRGEGWIALTAEVVPLQHTLHSYKCVSV